MQFITILFIVSGLTGYANVAWSKVQLETIDNTPIYAQILDEYRKVGELSAKFAFTPAKKPRATSQLMSETVPLAFGNGVGFIASDVTQKATSNTQSAVKKTTDLAGYIITTQPTALYSDMQNNISHSVLLEPHLRYPFMRKLPDQQGKLWYQVALAGQFFYIKESDVQADKGIPIVMYHHVLQDQENRQYRNTPTTVSTDALQFQFGTMKALGFKTVDLNVIAQYLQGKINLPAKVVVLTFDDGLKSVYRYAYTLLNQFEFSATLFVITSRIQQEPQLWAPDNLQFLSISEYDEMKNRVNLQSHSHSMHHYKNFKPAAPQTDYQTLYIDLVRSKQELEKLGSKTTYLAYPFGAYNDDYIKAARNTGFTLALTTKWGKVQFGDDPMLLKRVYFISGSSKEKIAATLENR